MATCRTDEGDASETDDSVGKETCAICLEKYRRPKLLPCFHSFCQACLQGVAGCSPSFPCPSCRKVVLLPAGGIGALQTNFYIEDMAAVTSSPPPQPLCDVCTDDREATHSCLQCQQRFCLPCRRNHDSFRLFRGHTVVSVTQEQGIPAPEKLEMEMCPQHPDQRLLLHCGQCQADLCLQCKLTLHEGHPTEDLTHTRSRVKQKLKDRLGSLTLQLQQMDHMAAAFDDRCSKLQQQRERTEHALRGRGEALHQWVSQSVEDAVGSVGSSCEELARPWQDQAAELRRHKLAVQAQQDHILRVLKEGKEAEIASLEAQLSASSGREEVKVEQMERELTRDIPTLLVEHSTAAVNQPQLRAFIGVLEPAQQTSGAAGDTPVAGRVQGKAPDAASAGESDLTWRADGPSPAGNGAVTKQSKEFVYSTSPRVVVVALCPISHGRLWVMFRAAPYDRPSLKLLDAEGEVLVEPDIQDYYDGLCSISENAILAWKSGSIYCSFIMPNGRFERHSHGVDNVLEWYAPCGATSQINYRKFENLKHVKGVKYAPVTDHYGYTNANESSMDSVTTNVPSDREPAHVSPGGRYFAFLAGKIVEVYVRASTRLFSFCSYETKVFPTDARFCLMDGREMLLVAVCEDKKIHVIDHTDSGRFVRYLDTGTLTLDRPWRLATDFDQHVWVGCEGGRVVRVDL